MGNKGTCKAESCEKDVVGKGYCERHYRDWKRGKMPKARYKTCVHEGCRKPQVAGARCEEHRKDKSQQPAAEAAEAAGTTEAAAAPA